MIRRSFACLYEVLKISKKADKNEVKSAFYRLAKIHHPDLTGASSEEFKKLKEAYDVLIDDDKRYQYDLSKGYLNALDIDEMELKVKKFGSRYFSDVIDQVNQFDKALEDSFDFSQGHKNKEKGPVNNELRNIRLKFFICLTGGYIITYNSMVFIIETYIYPTK